MLIELKCGTVQETGSQLWLDLREHMRCSNCNTLQKVVAVETREWKVKCNYPRCPVGKWTGQDLDYAKSFARAHVANKSHHQTQTIDYMCEPGKVMKLRNILGPRVKAVILKELGTVCERTRIPTPPELPDGKVPF